jgi:HD-GYP domain-containing protein (c-di-GMP phosphodiesterase class II)
MENENPSENSQLKDQKVENYFTSPLTALIPGKALTFNIHLFFKKNQHMIALKRKGDILIAGLIQHWEQRGVRQVWIHCDDRELFTIYLKSDNQPTNGLSNSNLPKPDNNDIGKEQSTAVASSMTSPAASSPSPIPAASSPLASTTPPTTAVTQSMEPTLEEASLTLIELFKARQMEDKKKIALIAKRAREIIRKTMSARDSVSLTQAHKNAQETIKELFQTIPATSQVTLLDLWKTSDLGLELHHAIQVATYSVLTALAFGKIDPELLADLALAGFLHDVGLSQIPLQITLKPLTQMTPEMQVAYSKHISAGLEIINAFGSDIPQRVKDWIEQHHEKFDGSGYPKQLPAPKITIPAQLLGIAELLDSIATGQLDGKTRTYREALEKIQELERSRNTPQYLNPEVLSAVFRWIKA